jgi:hypothetical protein
MHGLSMLIDEAMPIHHVASILCSGDSHSCRAHFRNDPHSSINSNSLADVPPTVFAGMNELTTVFG